MPNTSAKKKRYAYLKIQDFTENFDNSMELSKETDIDSTDIGTEDEEFKLEDLVVQVGDIADILNKYLMEIYQKKH